MDVLKQSWAQIKKTWEGLTGGQRAAGVVLAGALVATLLAVPLWGGSSDRVALFPHPLESDEKVGAVLGVLRAADIDARSEKGQILVPAAAREQAFVVLSSKKAWPEDQSTVELNTYVDDWRLSDQARKERARLMLQASLVRMIRKLDGVQGADVILAEGNNSIFSGERFEPKGTVTLTLKPQMQRLSPGVADTIRRMVAFGVQGIQPSTVNVSDSLGHIYPETPAEDDQQVTIHYEKLRQEIEERNNVMVRNALADAGLRRVAVITHVVLNRDKVTEEELRLNPDEVVVSHEETESKTVTGGAGDLAGVPGQASNIVEVPPSSSSGGAGMNSTEEKSKLDRRASEMHRNTVKAVGDVRQMSVGILIPFAKGSTEPDAKVLGTYREFAMNAVGIQDAKLVTVAAVPYEPEAPMAAPGRLQEIQAFLAAHFDRVLLAVLVLGALAVLGMALRRASPASAPAPTGLEGAVAAIARSRQEGVEPLAEMGPDGKRFNEMETRIREQVRKDPKIAAGLVKRWLIPAK